MYALPHLLRSHAQGLTVRHGPGLMPTAGIICGTILHNASWFSGRTGEQRPSLTLPSHQVSCLYLSISHLPS